MRAGGSPLRRGSIGKPAHFLPVRGRSLKSIGGAGQAWGCHAVIARRAAGSQRASVSRFWCGRTAVIREALGPRGRAVIARGHGSPLPPALLLGVGVDAAAAARLLRRALVAWRHAPRPPPTARRAPRAGQARGGPGTKVSRAPCRWVRVAGREKGGESREEAGQPDCQAAVGLERSKWRARLSSDVNSQVSE